MDKAGGATLAPASTVSTANAKRPDAAAKTSATAQLIFRIAKSVFPTTARTYHIEAARWNAVRVFVAHGRRPAVHASGGLRPTP